MRYLMPSLLCTVLAATAAAQDAKQGNQASVSKMCSIKTVAVVGDDDDAKWTRSRVEKATWMKRVKALGQADAVLEVQVTITSFSFTQSAGKEVTSASQEGRVEMKLKRRQPEELLWEKEQDFLMSRNTSWRPVPLEEFARPGHSAEAIDRLLASLKTEAGCKKR